MPLLQADEHLPVIVGDERAVREREVVVVRRQAEILQDLIDLIRRDHLADGTLDLGEDLPGGLDAHAGAGAQMQGHLARLDLREVILAHEGEQHAGQPEHAADDADGDDPVAQHRVEQADIAPVEPREAALEVAMDPAGEPHHGGADETGGPGDPAPAGGLVLRPVLGVLLPVFRRHDHVDQQRHQGAREQVGGQHREHDRERLRGEQVFRRVGQREHRREGRADRER